MTTSSSARGGLPSEIVKPFSSSESIQFPPKVGGPFSGSPTASPSLSTSCA
jgi:hypothetical protein